MMGARARVLFAVLYVLGAVAAVVVAQPLPQPPASQPRGHAAAPPPRPTPFGRTMSTVITVAISVFFFLLFFCAYINQCRLAGDGGAPLGRNVAAAAGPGGPSRRGKRGLDPAVVATFPIVSYREIMEHKVGRGVLECAVCLTAFEEGDDLRLLPHCSHVFHPECIDPWLEARITCPLCRANLEKPAPPPHAAVAIGVPAQEKEDSVVDDDGVRKEEAVELEKLRGERRAARLRRSHSTGHSLISGARAEEEEQCECDDQERFTLRLPEHVREQVLSRC